MTEEEIIITPQKGVTFTVLSITMSIILIITIIITTFIYTAPGEAQGNTNPPGLLINILFPLLLITGLMFTYFSFKLPERLPFLRWLGACLNVFFLLVYGATLIFELAKFIG